MKKDIDLSENIHRVSGAIIFIYVLLHFTSYIIGNISLVASEKFLISFSKIINSQELKLIVPLAFIFFSISGIYLVIRRNTFKNLTVNTYLQIILLIIIPQTLIMHLIVFAPSVYSIDLKASHLYYLILDNGKIELKAIIILTIFWLYSFLHLKSIIILKKYYSKINPILITLFALILILSFTGLNTSKSKLDTLDLQYPNFKTNVINRSNPKNKNLSQNLNKYVFYSTTSYLLTLLLFLLGKIILVTIRIKKSKYTIEYPGGINIRSSYGKSILDNSLQNNIPHPHVCDGKGKCTTCRIRIDDGLDQLDPVSDTERRTLNKIGAPSNVRLACKTKPKSDIQVFPILPQNATADESRKRGKHRNGMYKEIAILFAGIRDFKVFQEQRLPHDVVFVLNQYFQTLGETIQKYDGYIDKFLGDGVMCLFGADGNIKDGCLNALKASKEISFKLDTLNKKIAHILDKPLTIGIGLHMGDAIIGELGYGTNKSISAIGEAIDFAIELEKSSKKNDCQLIVSKDLTDKAEIDFSFFDEFSTDKQYAYSKSSVYMIPSAGMITNNLLKKQSK
jgi:adenylate cyclase